VLLLLASQAAFPLEEAILPPTALRLLLLLLA
jgi:hypothetical protein